MGKKLPNELWARPVASKLSERRPLTLYLGANKENAAATVDLESDRERKYHSWPSFITFC